MRRVTRVDVATPYAKCIVCTVGTRSHILEPAEYDEYEQEIIVGESDEFASEQWEDIDTITKYSLAKEARVMCHKCWVKECDAFRIKIDNCFEDWVASPLMNIRKIVSAIKEYQYCKFAEAADSDLKHNMMDLSKLSKETLTRGALGGEEE